jgi:hypothetical protein
MKGQSKKHSMFETVASTAIGFSISVVANIICLPYFGANITLRSSLYMGVIFTVISLVRGYYVRRLFNCIQIKW